MPNAEIDWTRHKAIVFESDDWGGCTRTPCRDLVTYEQAEPLWEQSGFAEWRDWGRASLETAAQMQDLFDLLLSFRGGDGRPAVFCPVYLVANPDFDAIAASGFAEYVDIPIGTAYPHGWERPGTIEMGRDAMRQGIWYPLYHSRTHHYSGQTWVDMLRAGRNGVMRGFFDLRMFGICTDTSGDAGLEFDGMSPQAMQQFLRGGLRMFRDVFGFLPHCVAITDAVSRGEEQVRPLEETMAELGTPCRFCSGQREGRAMGEYDPRTRLTHIGRNASLEPLGSREREATRGAQAAYEQTLQAWRDGEPAILSSHRANYTRLFEDEQERGMGQLEEYLATVQGEHPDAVYLTTWEVVQLYRTGTSAIHFGWRDPVVEMICRNYSGAVQSVAVELPAGHAPVALADMRTGAEVAWEQTAEERAEFVLPEGDYCLHLHRVEGVCSN